MFRRLNESMAYPGAREKVWGAAFHWYVSDKSEILTVVQNELNRKQRLALVVDGQGTNTEIHAHSITTFIIKNSQE